jgi:hypothetical protein
MNERELAVKELRDNAEVRIANETVERIEEQKLKLGVTSAHPETTMVLI